MRPHEPAPSHPSDRCSPAEFYESGAAPSCPAARRALGRSGAGACRPALRLVHVRPVSSTSVCRHPAVNLGVGSGSHAEQTSAAMVGYERLCVEPAGLGGGRRRRQLALACALTAKNMS